MSEPENFYGTWILIPELSIYQHGDPPVSGRYVIRAAGANIEFEITWTDAVGEEFQIAFGGPLDGQKHDSDTPGISALMYEKIDDSTLDSTAYNGEEILLYARRVAAQDKKLLSVSQVTYTDNGTLTNFQVYRRDNT